MRSIQYLVTLTIKNEDERSESALLAAAGKGDEEAFRILYRRLAKPLFSMAFQLTGNQADAEELTQETFMELWKKAPDYEPSRAKPLTFAIRIIRNRAIDRLRKKARRDTILRDSGMDIAHSSNSDDLPGTIASLEKIEAAGAIRDAFQKLTPEQQSALELAYFQGMSQSEIASVLSKALGTVKSQIRRGLDRLRKELEGRL